jgi:gliding motility-associated-like protein
MMDSARTYTLDTINIKCHGNTDGRIYMFPTGGILAFGPSYYGQTDVDYEITSHYSGNNPIYDGLGAGEYYLKVKDFSGCVGLDKITLNEPEPLESVITIDENVTCSNPTGRVSLKKWGGTYFDTITPGYSVAHWIRYYGIQSPPAPVKDSNSIQAFKGPYIAWFSDVNGCIDYDTLPFLRPGDQPYLFAADTSDYGEGTRHYNISCAGSTDGFILFQVYPPNQYSNIYLENENGDIVRQYDSVRNTLYLTVDTLVAGKYFYRSEISGNAVGCSSEVQEITLTEPTLPIVLQANALISSYAHGDSTWNVSPCFTSTNGSITNINITGSRNSPYHYTWYKNGDYVADGSGNGYGNRIKLNNIGAGNYRLVVDDGFCFDSADYTLTAPKLLKLDTMLVTDNLCHTDNTGKIELSVLGGELFGGNYNYTWTEILGLNSNIANNLTAGIYHTSVTDSLGCSINASDTVKQPDALLITPNISNYNGYEISCADSSTGWINISVSGGTSAYIYNWVQNGTPVSTQQNINGLPAGTYDLTITDKNNCEASASYNLEEPAPLTMVYIVEDKKCNNYGNVDITSVSGGVPGYNYLWSNSETTSFIHDVDTGLYLVAITDQNLCTLQQSFSVGEINVITIDFDLLDTVSCFNKQDGTISANLSANAQTPYSIEWNNNPELNTLTIRNLGTGEYKIYIKDANDCMGTDTFNLTQPDQLVGDFELTSSSCYDTLDGALQFNAIGGNSGYHYYIGNKLVDESHYVDTLHAGEYKIGITDRKNCKTDTTITITQPLQLAIEEDRSKHIIPWCPDAPDGELFVNASGGTEPYSYSWQNQDKNTQEITGLKQGKYTVQVTDNHNCYTEHTINLVADLPICLVIPTAFSPNGDGINDTWIISNPNEQTNEDNSDLPLIYPNLLVKVFNRSGQLVWESKRGYPKADAWDGLDDYGRSLPVDSYHYIIYEGGKSYTGSVTIVK